jgi:hypothetical protein
MPVAAEGVVVIAGATSDAARTGIVQSATMHANHSQRAITPIS